MRILCLMVVSVMLMSAAMPVAAAPNKADVWGLFEVVIDTVKEMFGFAADSGDDSIPPPRSDSDPDPGDDEWGIMIDPNG